MTFQELRELAARVGFPDPDLAAAVAMAESSGNPRAYNRNSNGSVDRGLWQVNSIHGYSGTRLNDPQYNAAAALAISSGGRDFSPWVAYKSGAYKRYLPAGYRAGASGGARGALTAPSGCLLPVLLGAGVLLGGLWWLA